MERPTEQLVAAMLSAAHRGGLLLRTGATVDQSGWDFLVLHVTADDGTPWILRCPRTAAFAGRLRAEQAVLALAGEALPVAVPRWRRYGAEVVAYPRLAGVPAGTEDPHTLRYRWRVDPLRYPDRYLEPLGRSLARLHALAADGRRLGVPVEPPATARVRLADQLTRAHRTVELPDEWHALWQRWLSDPQCWSARPVVVHGDVHPGHTLVDHRGRLTGLLDWTNARIGDPALDFVDMTYAGGRAVLAHLLDSYGRHGAPVPAAMRRHILARTSFVWVTVALAGLARNRPWYLDVARRGMSQPPDDELREAFGC